MTVSPGYVQMMATYNAEMNRRVYGAAGRLDAAALQADRGAFWGSIQGTLAHLVWGDRQWLGRFEGGAGSPVRLADSAADRRPLPALAAERAALDAAITAWAGRVEQDWLDGELEWFSAPAERVVRRPLGVLVPHFFNHQTHHRGQVHAMLTAAGEATGDTDLFLVV